VTIITDGASTAQTTSAIYRLNGEDEASFTEEMDWRPDDFHRTYCPYRRLIGHGVMQQFTAAAQRSTNGTVITRATATLAEYVRRLQGEQYARDQIQPICRPITTLADRPQYDASSRRLHSTDDVFVTPSERIANVVDKPMLSTQRPLSVNVTNQSTAEADKDDRHPVVIVVATPTIESIHEQNVDVGRTMGSASLVMSSEQSTEQRRSSTPSDDTDEFVDVSETVEDSLPSRSVHQPVDARHQITDVIEPLAAHYEDVTSLRENGHNRGLPNDHDDVVHHVTSCQSTDVKNGWPSREPGNNGMLYNDSDIVMMTTRNYVIQENTRKTIRSDI